MDRRVSFSFAVHFFLSQQKAMPLRHSLLLSTVITYYGFILFA